MLIICADQRNASYLAGTAAARMSLHRSGSAHLGHLMRWESEFLEEASLFQDSVESQTSLVQSLEAIVAFAVPPLAGTPALPAR
jgi:hypothetical protein